MALERQARPPFAAAPGPGQVSVGLPAPARLATDMREVVMRWGDLEVACSRRAVLVLETGHPPSVYLPWDDVARHLLQPGRPAARFCRVEGAGAVLDAGAWRSRLPRVAWSYPQPLVGAEALARVCGVLSGRRSTAVSDGAAVTAATGRRLLRGWITPELVGPFKGEPGQRAVGSEGHCRISAAPARSRCAAGTMGVKAGCSGQHGFACVATPALSSAAFRSARCSS